MFGANHKERVKRIDQAEDQLSQVIDNLNAATGKVQKQANSLGEIAKGLEELREALGSDRDKVNV